MPNSEGNPQPRRKRRPRRREPIKYEIRSRSGEVRPAFVVDDVTGCWISTGPSTGNGYRRTSGKPAHKDAYERLYGEVPEGFECHHLCHNRECVNAAEHIVILPIADHRKLHAHDRRKGNPGHTETGAKRARPKRPRRQIDNIGMDGSGITPEAPQWGQGFVLTGGGGR